MDEFMSDDLEHGNVSLLTRRLMLVMPLPNAAPQIAAYLRRNHSRYAKASPLADESSFSNQRVTDALSSAISDYEKKRSMRLYMFEIGASDNPIGDIALSEIVRGPFQACFMGYRIDACYEGRGYVSESISAVVSHAFEVLNLHRLMANYMPTNERSARILRRAGFVVDGYARDYLYLDGQWRDHILTSLINPNWIGPSK